jgi:cell division protein FtsB
MAKQELRMMKNRESAARSRARRQQHTVQLEQENEDLRAQVQDLQTTAERLREQVGLQDSPRAAYQLPTHQLLHS